MFIKVRSLCVIVQVTQYRAKHAGLLTSATMFVYTSVVLFNALSSEALGDRCVLTIGNVSSGLQVCPHVCNQCFFYKLPQETSQSVHECT